MSGRGLKASCLICGPIDLCRCFVKPADVVASDRELPTSPGLLDGVNARLDALEAKTADLLRQEGVMELLLEHTAKLLEARERIAQLDAQVLGLLRRTRRPGEKLPGRKRT